MAFKRTDSLITTQKWFIDFRTTIEVNEKNWQLFKAMCKEKNVRPCDVLDCLLQDWFEHEDKK